jgi:hypothetical protein
LLPSEPPAPRHSSRGGSTAASETTIAYLRENGGGCDCEVLLNVDAEDDRLRLFLSRQE